MRTFVKPQYLPANRSEVTESWLIETLADHTVFAADPIDSVTLEDLGNTGYLSTMSLARLTCKSGSERQLVIKMHTDVPGMHDIAVRYGHYESEVNFYRYFAHQVPMRTPVLYAVEMDHQTERVLIIMESFAGWHSPDQIEGATLDEVTIAVEALAGLTAAFWNAPLRTRYPWLRDLASDAYKTVPADYVASIDSALTLAGDTLPAGVERAARTIGNRIEPLMTRLNEGNQALSHWDYRVENFLYGPDDEFVVIDWQLMMVTNPATDLAYLLGTNIDVELRRRAEADLMARYLEGLKRHGVTGYTRNDLERDWRLAMLGITAIPVIGGAGTDLTNERQVQFSRTIMKRLFQAIEDWDALALLP